MDKVEPVERVQCTECGAMILPATAEKWAGLCAPCGQKKKPRGPSLELGHLRLGATLSSHAKSIFLAAYRVIAGIDSGLIQVPSEEIRKGAPLGTGELLLGAAMHLDTSLASRYLLASGVPGVENLIHSFHWDKYRYLLALFSQVDANETLSKMSLEECFENADIKCYEDWRYNNLHLHLIDAKDYAQWACDDSPGMKAPTPPINTRHIVLSTLSDCACCPASITGTGHIFASEQALSIYHGLRYLKTFPGELEFTRNHLLGITFEKGELRVTLRARSADFSHYGAADRGCESPATLFKNCRPPIFLEPELAQFADIISQGARQRERDLQEFFETRSHFLRAIGFSSFAAQVHLTPQDQPLDRLQDSASLCLDFLAKDVGDGSPTIVELKRTMSRMVVGSGRRKRFSAELSRSLSQLEDYYLFFEQSSNRQWFEQKYGQSVYKPELVLVVGDGSLRRLGMRNIVPSPVASLPIRVIGAQDIVDVIRSHHLVVPTDMQGLE